MYNTVRRMNYKASRPGQVLSKAKKNSKYFKLVVLKTRMQYLF